MTAKLAICGGIPLRKTPFPAYNTIGKEEKKAVMEVLESGVLSAFLAQPNEFFEGGPKVKVLERDWEKYFGCKYAISINSATSGLHAAVYACGVGPGHEVIVSPLTMSGTVSAILFSGAVPVFTDIDPETLLIDPHKIEQQISSRTRAIIVVHLAGLPCEMDKIMAIAKKHDLKVIEDNAQAPGAFVNGQSAGCLGDLGVFSLNCHKTIQCGEGGIVCTDNDDLALQVKLFRNHGENCVEVLGDSSRHKIAGLNLRMTEMEAAVARCQLHKLDQLNAPRIKMAKRMNNALQRFDGIDPLPRMLPDGYSHVYYVYLLNYNEKIVGIPIKYFADAVQAEGIPLSTGWATPLYNSSLYRNLSAFHESGFPWSHPSFKDVVFQYGKGTCPNADRANEYLLCSYNLFRWPFGDNEVDLMVAAFEKVLTNKQELLELDG